MAEARTQLARRRSSANGVVLGSVGGFPISLDYSWFVIFFLIFGTFTGAVFPSYVPGLDQQAYLLMGIVGTILFFASLVGHELAHAWMARALGIEVEGITLFVFGGMARTRSEAPRPRDEFLIAVVGPLASLTLGAACYAVAITADQRLWHPAVFGVAGHIAFLNFALGVFNLLPGFPLDGGRILRSLIWRVTGSLRRATQVASLAGKGIGWLIIAIGVYALFVTDQLVTGLWFIFIGWFLANAAAASYEQILLRHVLEGRTAADAMTHFPETVEPEVTLDVLVRDYFLHRPYNSFPVTDDGIVIGLITLSQVKHVDHSAWKIRTVADVMTPLAETLIVSPSSPMNEVIERMSENETRRVIVAQDWELRGIITGGDVANWLERAGLVGS
jgi:Zn-dependent protease/CBS domain-containing protein